LRITCIGHAGLYIETRYGDILCDPWVNPAYFGSWCVFPDNSGLDWDRLGQAKYLYVSHLHKDHFDPGLLRDHVSKDTTVLLPDYPVTDLREALEGLGFTSFRTMPDCEPVELGGLRLMIQALRSPTDGPLGDSALAVSDGTATILNQNDARPGDLDPLVGFGPFDVHFLQYSGAIWWPWTYELPEAAKRAFGAAKRANGLDRAVRYVQAIGARYVVPNAGPPCFLDEELFFLNDIRRDSSSTFPDQPVFLDYLKDQGIAGGQLMVPGAVMTVEDGRCEVSLPGTGDEALRPYTDKAAYLAEYAARVRPGIEAQKRTWPVPGVDILTELKAWFEPLLELADHIKAAVGGPVLLRIRDGGLADGHAQNEPAGNEPAGNEPAGNGAAAHGAGHGEAEERIVIDFPAGQVRPFQGETCRYEFTFERPLIERLIADHQVDWVNSLFLSLRFRARRVGQYNEYIYTFFKCLAPDRLMYAEGWYADQKHDEGDIRLGDWMVQRRCPHLRGDLSRFGSVEGTTLTCAMHGWQFDLPTGRCLTSEAPGHELRSRPVSQEDEPGRPVNVGDRR
jgi:UDP-MurNAc hydroxylase